MTKNNLGKRKLWIILISVFSVIVLATASVIGILGYKKNHQFDWQYTPSKSYQNGVYYKNLCKYKLSGDMREDICAVALSQVGYHEGNNDNELDGSNKGGCSRRTEYSYWFGTQVRKTGFGYYQPWCSMFVGWCAAQAQVPNEILSRVVYPNCVTDLFKSDSYYQQTCVDYTANMPIKKGDILFFENTWDNGGRRDIEGWDHVAIVVDVDDEYIYTVEGNYVLDVREAKYRRDTGEGFDFFYTEIRHVISPLYNS